MAQQTINIGGVPNDGTGDTIRDGGDKINDNFTELYAAIYTDEKARDALGTALTAGAGVTVTPNDGADTITIATTITQYTDEMARDALGAALTAGTGITVTPNDGADTITVATTITQYTDEMARDALGTALTAGTGITITPNDGADTITIASSVSAYAGGVQSTPILAAAMTSRTTNGAASGSTETTTNKVMLATLDFDQSTIEYAQFMFPMPKSWNESTVTAQFIWTASAGSGDVIWGLQGVAISNDDPLDAAFGTAQEVTDTLTATGDQDTTSFTSAITIGGSPAEGDLVCFQVYRKASDGSDTLNADAKLIGIRLNFTTNAADDS